MTPIDQVPQSGEPDEYRGACGVFSDYAGPEKCICNSGFGMNLSCPTHSPYKGHAEYSSEPRA